MIKGRDVSAFQGAYPWNQGEAFGIAKATEGTFLRDSTFAHNWALLKAKGLRRGAYHFAHPGTSPTAQAAFFVAFVKAHGLEASDALVLDLEVSDGRTAAQVAAWAVAWCNAVESSTAKNVWIYTDHAFISGGFTAGLFKHPLWIADPSEPAGAPSSVHPWPVWVMHQYGEAKSPTGGMVDLDILNGDTGVWDELVNLVPASTATRTVTAKWQCRGQLSLVALCAERFGGTSAGVGASTVIRFTLDNSPGQVFTADLAAYLSAGDLVNKPVPKGVTLYYPKLIKG